MPDSEYELRVCSTVHNANLQIKKKESTDPKRNSAEKVNPPFLVCVCNLIPGNGNYKSFFSGVVYM